MTQNTKDNLRPKRYSLGMCRAGAPQWVLSSDLPFCSQGLAEPSSKPALFSSRHRNGQTHGTQQAHPTGSEKPGAAPLPLRVAQGSVPSKRVPQQPPSVGAANAATAKSQQGGGGLGVANCLPCLPLSPQQALPPAPSPQPPPHHHQRNPHNLGIYTQTHLIPTVGARGSVDEGRASTLYVGENIQFR